jgi:hypothetical protein
MGNAESLGPRPTGIPRWLVIALAPVVGLVAVPAVVITLRAEVGRTGARKT